MELKASTQ